MMMMFEKENIMKKREKRVVCVKERIVQMNNQKTFLSFPFIQTIQHQP